MQSRLRGALWIVKCAFNNPWRGFIGVEVPHRTFVLVNIDCESSLVFLSLFACTEVTFIYFIGLKLIDNGFGTFKFDTGVLSFIRLVLVSQILHLVEDNFDFFGLHCFNFQFKLLLSPVLNLVHFVLLGILMLTFCFYFIAGH